MSDKAAAESQSESEEIRLQTSNTWFPFLSQTESENRPKNINEVETPKAATWEKHAEL